MKKLITFLAIVAPFFACAQTSNFNIEVIKTDSMYIVERTTSEVTAAYPRPQTVTTYHLVRSTAEIMGRVDAIRKAAREEQQKAMQILETVRLMNEAADKIEAALNAKT